jgi:hypothetical protein
MVVKILIVWFFLTLPIVYHVDKSMKGTQADWMRHKPMFQIILICRAFWNVPIFYIILIKDLLTKKK